MLFRSIRQMYIQPALAASETIHESDQHQPDPVEIVTLGRPSLLILTVLGLGLVAVLWLGVYPAPLLDFIEAASRSILQGG